MKEKFKLKELGHLPYGRARPIPDPEMLNFLDSLDPDIGKIYQDPAVLTNFVNTYYNAIVNDELNFWNGLELFKGKIFSQGTTEAFDKFYMKNSSRRFRCFRGEYQYHALVWDYCFPNWEWIDTAPLDSNDAVVISLPFADTGNEHSQYHNLLQECTTLKIPVFVDCAYLGICRNVYFDFGYSCITDIAFSLSKSTPLSHARLGIRLTRENNNDALFVMGKNDYGNRLGAWVGTQILNEFNLGYVADKYKDKQKEFCQQLKVIPSKCVLFGLGDSQYQAYNRGTDTNRLSFFNYFVDGKLPTHLDTTV